MIDSGPSHPFPFSFSPPFGNQRVFAFTSVDKRLSEIISCRLKARREPSNLYYYRARAKRLPARVGPKKLVDTSDLHTPAPILELKMG